MSKRTQILTHGLLSGEINGAGLQGALENGGFLGAWYSLLKSRDIEELLRSQTSLDSIFGSAIALESVLAVNGAAFAASDSATAALAASSSAMIAIVSDTSLLNLWNNVPANKTRLQTLINQSGSCLVRYEITSGPNWSPPDGEIQYASALIIGAGGNGGQGAWGTAGGGGGGGAGQTRTFTLPGGIANSSHSLTIGSNSDTVIFSQTATAGTNGLTNTTGGTGGGSDSGSIYDAAPATAIFQPNTASKKGPNGGNGGGSPGASGSAGTAGLSGTGGSGGASSSGGGAGSGLASSGGGGAYPNFTSGGNGGSGAGGSAYGCGGGGGSVNTTGSSFNFGPGGSGRQGVIYIYGVLGAPKA